MLSEAGTTIIRARWWVMLTLLALVGLAACTDDMARATPTGRAWVQRDKGGADVH